MFLLTVKGGNVHAECEGRYSVLHVKTVKHTNPFILIVCLLIRALIFSLLHKWEIGEKCDVFH